MKFKVSAVLAISLMFTITNCISFAEIGNSDVKTVKSITVSENNALAPEVAAPEVAAPEVVAPEVVAPEVVAPEVVVPEVVAPEVVAPEVVAPEVVAPEVVAPEVVAPEVVAPEVVVPEEVVPEVVAPELPVIGEVVDIEDQLVALAPILPEIKAECSLVITNKIKGEENEFVFEEKLVGLHVGDVVNLSDYIHENEDVKAITQGESIVLKEGVNEVVVEYQCVLLNEKQDEVNNDSLMTDTDEWTR